MSATDHPTPWEAIEHLYSLVTRLSHGAASAEVAEHAISLALSPKRANAPTPQFLHDVGRNARHSVLRSRRRRAALYKKCEAAAKRGVGIVDPVTPESIFLAREFILRLGAAVAPSGVVAARCLQGMIAGETVGETAAACGVSSSTVDRMRGHIRRVAASLLCEDVV